MPKQLALSFTANCEEEEIGRIGRDPVWRVVRRTTAMVADAQWNVPVREVVEGLLVAEMDRDPGPADLPSSAELARFAPVLGFRELECGEPRRSGRRVEVPLGPKRPPRVGVIETLAVRHAGVLATVLLQSRGGAGEVNPVATKMLERIQADVGRLVGLLEGADPALRPVIEEAARLASNAASLLTALEVTFTDAPRLAVAERLRSAQRAGGASRARGDAEARLAAMTKLVDSGTPVRAAAREVATKHEHCRTAEELERAIERNVKLYRRRMEGRRSPVGRGRPRSKGTGAASDPAIEGRSAARDA